jgi:hypothetical protein
VDETPCLHSSLAATASFVLLINDVKNRRPKLGQTASYEHSRNVSMIFQDAGVGRGDFAAASATY